MHFANFLRPDPFLECERFVILCQATPRSDEVDYKIHETLAFQERIWTRRKSAKRIIYNLYRKHSWKLQEYSEREYIE